MRKTRRLSWSRISAELKRRQVYPVVIAYAVVAWFVLQFGEVTFEPLSAPSWAMPALIVAVVLGFPVAVVLAWMYDIKPLRIKRDVAAQVSEGADRRSSIAVLPFLDLSPAGDQGYFCEGVAEEILNALSRIRQLRVAARSSSFQFDPNAGDVRDVGRKLGVETILEGSVRKDGNRLRITAQLVNVHDGYHLWSKTFDEQIENIFVIQDEIASSIASALVQTITNKERKAIHMEWVETTVDLSKALDDGNYLAALHQATEKHRDLARAMNDNYAAQQDFLIGAISLFGVWLVIYLLLWVFVDIEFEGGDE